MNKTYEEFNGYFIMPRYGQNLESILRERDYTVLDENVYSLGLQLINILEQISQVAMYIMTSSLIIFFWVMGKVYQ